MDGMLFGVRELTALLGLGAFSGLVVGLYDGVGLTASGTRPVTVALLTGVMGALGVLFALLLHVLSALAGVLARAFGDRVRIPLLQATLACVVLLPIWRETFSGAGVSRTWLGGAGPWIASLATWLGSAIAAALVRDWPRRARESRGVLVAGVMSCALATPLVLSLDGRTDPHAYPQLHALLLAAALGSTLCALAPLVRSPRAHASALLATLALLLAGVGFPRDQDERELLALGSYAVLRPMRGLQQLVDRDRDGHSPLFGGGDCDDGDPRVHAGAPERPSDGRDTNCDGRDDPPLPGLQPQPFQLDRDRARAIADAARGRPTVVLLVDALRGDRVGDARFPNLAQLARESIQFTQAFSSSASTSTSVPTIVSARVRPKYGEPTVAELLKHAGRRAAYIGVDIVAESVRGQPAARPGLDFDAFAGFDPMVLVPTQHDRTIWGGNVTVATDAAVTDRALALIRSKDPPALLVVHYFDQHQWNFLQLEGLPSRMTYPRYDAVLRYVDNDLARWLGVRDQINLVLLADHGEALGAHGQPFHRGFVFREMVHVPLLVRVPGVNPARVDTPVGLAAVAPMLLALAGVRAPAGMRDGVLGLIGVDDPGPGPGFASFESNQWGLVYDRYHLVYTPSVSLLRLYDLARDPGERRDIRATRASLASAMMQYLAIRADQVGLEH